MVYKRQKFLCVFAVLLALSLQTDNSTAATMTMEELKEHFFEQTGKRWEQSTRDEGDDFMYREMGFEQKIIREKRIEGETAPYFIQEGYKRVHGKKWKDATLDEQRYYIDAYKVKKKEKEFIAEQRILNNERRAKDIKLERQREKDAFLAKQREREQIRKDKELELERRRAEEKRRIEEAKRKLRDLQNAGGRGRSKGHRSSSRRRKR